jgi:hypothetical protein
MNQKIFTVARKDKILVSYVCQFGVRVKHFRDLCLWPVMMEVLKNNRTWSLELIWA